MLEYFLVGPIRIKMEDICQHVSRCYYVLDIREALKLAVIDPMGPPGLACRSRDYSPPAIRLRRPQFNGPLPS